MMSKPSNCFAVSEMSDSFDRQVIATREALNNFSVIASLNAPGPAKAAMEDLVNITVRCSFRFKNL